MSTEIKSGKIRSGLFLTYSYVANLSTRKDTTGTKSDAVMHEDCQNAFRDLLPHLILLCEQKRESPELKRMMTDGVAEDDAINKEFVVTGFTIDGANDNESVQIHGHKILSTFKNLSLDTPRTKLNSTDDDYKHATYLRDAVDVVRNEVYEYMNGKCTPSKDSSQITMDLIVGKGNDEEFNEPAHADADQNGI